MLFRSRLIIALAIGFACLIVAFLLAKALNISPRPIDVDGELPVSHTRLLGSENGWEGWGDQEWRRLDVSNREYLGYALESDIRAFIVSAGVRLYSMSIDDADQALNRISQIYNAINDSARYDVWILFGEALNGSVENPTEHISRLPFYAEAFTKYALNQFVSSGDPALMHIFQNLDGLLDATALSEVKSLRVNNASGELFKNVWVGSIYSLHVAKASERNFSDALQMLNEIGDGSIKRIVEPDALASIAIHYPEEALGYYLHQSQWDWSGYYSDDRLLMNGRIGMLIGEWSDEDPESLYEELLKVPRSSRRDEIMRYLITKQSKHNLDAAYGMLQGIADLETRQTVGEWLNKRALK